MIVAHADGEPLALHPGVGSAKGRFIGGGRVVPHAELEKDVRGHVQGVARLGRDLRVGARRGKGQPSVFRVVVIMDQIVESSRMIGIPGQHPLQDGRRLLLDLASHQHVLVLVVAPLAEERRAARHPAHEREGEEAERLRVLRIRLGERTHLHGVRAIPGRAVPAPEQDLDRPQVALLAVRLRLHGARFRRRPQPEQDLARHVRILVEPEGLVVGHGLPPVGHGEVAIDALGLAESLHGVLVLEVVEGGHAPQEGALGRS